MYFINNNIFFLFKLIIGIFLIFCLLNILNIDENFLLGFLFFIVTIIISITLITLFKLNYLNVVILQNLDNLLNIKSFLIFKNRFFSLKIYLNYIILKQIKINFSKNFIQLNLEFYKFYKILKKLKNLRIVFYEIYISLDLIEKISIRLSF